ncbi:hypothetical protein BCR37DRAFT_230392 [Protomyces lactucae-debilis]|uniref:Uncharacterized protein n=1 Tax=Protomyces lactucae-debilis TaxID=2754530 RepID=A0A1Y2EQ43_PROLT|nr:uncharacterized protein BCR37DRAFT_230392 [Protomyces lactucae-debilis]ORY73669.1 hypothetical protein BCR37DRAFT_230392 [Protomyces lactucae-debilis]
MSLQQGDYNPLIQTLGTEGHALIKPDYGLCYFVDVTDGCPNGPHANNDFFQIKSDKFPDRKKEYGWFCPRKGDPPSLNPPRAIPEWTATWWDSTKHMCDFVPDLATNLEPEYACDAWWLELKDSPPTDGSCPLKLMSRRKSGNLPQYELPGESSLVKDPIYDDCYFIKSTPECMQGQGDIKDKYFQVSDGHEATRGHGWFCPRKTDDKSLNPQNALPLWSGYWIAGLDAVCPLEAFGKSAVLQFGTCWAQWLEADTTNKDICSLKVRHRGSNSEMPALQDAWGTIQQYRWDKCYFIESDSACPFATQSNKLFEFTQALSSDGKKQRLSLDGKAYWLFCPALEDKRGVEPHEKYWTPPIAKAVETWTAHWIDAQTEAPCLLTLDKVKAH